MKFKEIAGNWKGIIWEPLGRDWNSSEAHEDARDIARAGITWARISFNADESFDLMDKKVAMAKEHNINILGCYNKENPKRDLGTEDQVAEQVSRLKAVTERYRKDIRYWEIQNEPNLDMYWNPDGGEGVGSKDPEAPFNQGAHRYVIC